MVATLQNEFRKVGFAGYDVPEFVLVYFLGFFAMDQYRTVSESVAVITAAHRDSRVPITAGSLFRGGRILLVPLGSLIRICCIFPFSVGFGLINT